MKVSVIIPVYNAAPFLERCLMSALKQPETGEVICIDDQSSDESLSICYTFQHSFDNLVVLKNETEFRGAAMTRNIGIDAAKFDYVAFLDADDFYLEERFSDDSLFFESNPVVDGIANTLIFLTPDGSNIHQLNINYTHEGKLGFKPSFSRITMTKLSGSNTFSIIGLTLRKSVFEKTGTFDIGLKQCEDSDFILRLLITANIYAGNSDRPVVVYNRHSTNTTNNIEEAVFYRMKAAKKHFFLAVKQKLGYKLVKKYFLDFAEYQTFSLFRKDIQFKSLVKILIFPYILFKLFSNNVPQYEIYRR